IEELVAKALPTNAAGRAGLGVTPARNAIYEICVPQINSRADLGAMQKIGTLYEEAIDGIFAADAFLAARIPEPRRARLIELVKRVQLVPLVENVGALAHLPELLQDLQPDAPAIRVFVAMSDTAESSGKIATDVAYTLAMASRDAIPRQV